MLCLNHHHDPISTVQLSPFIEEQWHRIDTYRPACADWTDPSMYTPRRSARPTSGKLNAAEQVDLNTLKLEDEILLNELNDIRRGSALLARAKYASQELRALREEDAKKPTITPASSTDQPKAPLKPTLTGPSLASQPRRSERPLPSAKVVIFRKQSSPCGLERLSLVKYLSSTSERN